MENDKQPLKKVSILQHLPKSNVDESKPIFQPRPAHEFAIPNPLNKPKIVVDEVPPKVKERDYSHIFKPNSLRTSKVVEERIFPPLKPITDAEWDELNRNHMAMVHATQRKKRPQKYNTTYCFNLSKAQLEALSTYAKFNNTSKSNCIRKAITEMLNKGRI